MVTVSLTTMKEREKALKETLESLLDQVDIINIFLHGYTDIPEFLINPKINLAHDIEFGDRGDLDKFHWVSEVKEGYHLVTDDDLIFPPDFITKTIEALDRIGHDKYIAYLGCAPYPLPIANYYLDRHQFPCLGTVPEDVRVPILGTCNLFYDAEVNYTPEFRTKDMARNMSDIHFSIWAGEKDKELYVARHEEGWIKHSPHVHIENTIFSQYVNSPYEQTRLINSRPELFRTEIMRPDFIVSVVVVNSRGKSHPHWVKKCYDSLRMQTYPKVEVIVVNNISKLMTIGKAFNDGVKRARGKYVLFVADDDYIAEAYIAELVNVVETARSAGEPVVQATSYLTMFQELDNGLSRSEPRELIPTGMWLRDYLLEYPFVEYLTRYIDTEKMDRAKEQGFKTAIAYWNYGYFYRSHEFQASGHKSMIGAHEGGSRLDDVYSEFKESLPELIYNPNEQLNAMEIKV